MGVRFYSFYFFGDFVFGKVATFDFLPLRRIAGEAISAKSILMWLVRLFILCPVPMAAGIILFITIPLSTRNSLIIRFSASIPICFAFATADKRSFFKGSPARFARKSIPQPGGLFSAI